MSIKMRCVGIGVYHDGPGGIEKPGDFGWRIDTAIEIRDGQAHYLDGQKWIQIALHCPRTGTCMQYVREAPKDAAGNHLMDKGYGDDAKQRWWAWNGDFENPTLHPSIGCDDLRTRCGQHMVITNGHITGTCEYVRKPRESRKEES